MRLRMAVVAVAIAYSVPVAPAGQQSMHIEPSVQLKSAQFSLAPSSAGKDCAEFEGSDNFRLIEQKWQHIEAPKHGWRTFGYFTRSQVSSAMSRALSAGKISSFRAACQAQLPEKSPNGKSVIVTVTYVIVAKTARIGSAWVTGCDC